MRTALVSWAACLAVGGAIVALPDDRPRLVSFSDAHGPSALDALGIGFLLVGWAVFVAALWQRRGQVASRAGAGLALGGPFAVGLGAGLVIASVASDYPHLWVVGAGILVAVQVLAAYAAARP